MLSSRSETHDPDQDDGVSEPELEKSTAARTTDYATYSNADLIARITSLERQLRDQTARVASLTTKPASSSSTKSQKQKPLLLKTDNTLADGDGERSPRSPERRAARPFDPSLYSTRHIALKFAYLGGRYGGFEHANGNVSPKPTIEEVLWKALRKARLISPPVAEGSDESMEVVWAEEKRLSMYTRGGGGGSTAGSEDQQEKEKQKQKRHRHSQREQVRLDLNWDDCQYSKCGRTDRGVSAFGQVIGIRVRSNRPVPKPEAAATVSEESAQHEDGDAKPQNESTLSEGEELDVMPAIDADDLSTESYAQPFDPIKDELPYISILNSILPPDIRILAWCPDPPPAFDARFSCRERRYKYFFTNPAFCPTPGPLGMTLADGNPAKVREGWLDIERMRQAAKKLEGLHDFRNLCKIDASKQMPSCERRVTFADVVEFGDAGKVFSEHDGLNQFGSTSAVLGNGVPASAAGPKVYTFCVHGTAFLWHQVRCMVAVLFLVGQGLEEPSIVDELLDIKKYPGRPMYEMADDAPLVLWDCMFPDDEKEMVDSLNWLYAGDEANLSALATNASKNDGKFGTGAVVEELWAQWREAKISETLTGSLLDLAISQGDGTALRRGAQRDPGKAQVRSQKIFDGGDRGRIKGRYVPVAKKPKMDTLEVLNAKYANRRKTAAGANDEFEGSTGD